MKSKEKSDQDKVISLRSAGTLNPSPEKIIDPIFQKNDFFDPRDIVQVKYELLRKVREDGVSVSEAVKSFGFSRLSYYRTLAIFRELGLCGLVPQKRGPKQAHKINNEILKYIKEQVRENSSIRAPELKTLIEKKFKLTVHTRTIERALVKKKGVKS